MHVLNLKEEVFQLPSLGLAYNQETMPLINGDSIRLRPITAGDQRRLAGVGADPYRAYYTLIDRTVVEPKLNIEDLLMDDLLAILFAIRVKSFGKKYPVRYHCDECGERNDVDINLTEDINVTMADDLPDFKARELVLELDGHEVEIHMATMRDEKMVNRHLQNLKKSKRVTNPDTDRSYVRHAQLIDKIDGEEELTIEERLDFVDGLTMEGTRKLVEFQDENSIGISTLLHLTCDSCGFDNEQRLPLTGQFFRA